MPKTDADRRHGLPPQEFNPSDAEPVHRLQIWLLPERAGLKPGYEQWAFPEEEGTNRLRPAASPDGRDGSLTVRTGRPSEVLLFDLA